MTVLHPYDGTEIADVAVPGAEQVERAVVAADGIARTYAARPATDRARACDAIADLVAGRSEEIAETITAENGKPLASAFAEVTAAVAAFRAAAGEAGRLGGDLRDNGERRLAIVRRRSRGPALAVSPVTFPLGAVAHQVAAAVAVGAPVVVAPAVRTPMTALLLGEILAEADLQPGAFSVLPVADETLGALVADPRLPVVSSTGPEITAAGKHVVLEPIGTGAAVVCPDADVDAAARAIATFDVARHVIVPADVAERFVPALLATVGALRTGNPHDPAVQVGPLIDEAAAEDAVKWITSAVGAGAELLAGGTRTGACLAPTVLRDPPGDVPGPLLTLSVVDDLAAAFAHANGRTAVFTRDMATAFDAAAAIDGDVIVGDTTPGTEDVRSIVLAYTRDRTLLLTP